MPIAAIPDYLGKLDLSTASPGLRFGMYLRLWTSSWGIDANDKRTSLAGVSALTGNDRNTLRELINRQSTLAAPIAATGQLLTIDAKSIAPFSTGLGNEHPLENGFAFLHPYGLPYLPGSGVKGVLRQAARELAGINSGDSWEIESDWSAGAINALFGKEDSNDAQRGALGFWDVLPQIKGNNSLTVEVMTAHQSHYYQKGDSPHESGQPNPLNFLTVPPGSDFTFQVVCDLPFLARIAPELAAEDHWKKLLRQAFEHAFDWLGFGAKTAVGYGAMARNQEMEQKRQEEGKSRKRAIEQERQRAEDEQKKQERLAALNPTERRIEELIDDHADQPPVNVMIKALKAGEWQGEEAREAAEIIRQRMESKGVWRERSNKRRPEKDRQYQQTLVVMAILKGDP